MLGKILLAIIYPAGPPQTALNACNEVSKKPTTPPPLTYSSTITFRYFLQSSKILLQGHVVEIFQVLVWSIILFSVKVKKLMFTRGLNKFYCGSLCDTFKIISPTKTRYQTGEKVAQIQGQDDKFSAKSCQISGVRRIYFN